MALVHTFPIFPFVHTVYLAALVITLVCMVVATILFTTPLYGTLSYQLTLWWDARSSQVKRSYRSGSFLAVLGIIVLSVLDAAKLWTSATIGAGWVTPRRYRHIVQPYLLPFPSLPVSTDMFSPNKKSGGGGGYGINLAPMVSGWVIGFVQRKVTGWVGLLIKNAEEPKRRAEKEARREKRRKSKQEAQAHPDTPQAANRSRRDSESGREVMFDVD